jgi:hypothetical protein
MNNRRYEKMQRALACAAIFAVLFAFAPLRARAADHADSPVAASDQGADIGDVYFFLDPNDNTKAVMIMTVHGFIVPGEAANFGVFDPAVRYRFEIENTGDAKPDLFIDVRFSPRTATNGVPQAQTATITLSGSSSFNRTFTAPATNPSATSATPPTQVVTTDQTSGVSFFAGLTDDPFFFDIPAFGRFTASIRAGSPDPTVFQRGRDTFAGYNILSIALSVPVSMIKGQGNIVGLSGSTQRRTPQIYNAQTGEPTGFGRWQNVDREGLPAVNVALVPFNLKNQYNAATTVDDAAGRFASAIVATLQGLGTNAQNIGLLASLAVTNGDILRLDLTKQNTGSGGGNNSSAGFPNGRRLADDVIDTELTIIANGTPLGDNVNANDVAFQNSFPFLAPQQTPRAPGTIDDNTRN